MLNKYIWKALHIVNDVEVDCSFLQHQLQNIS